MKKKYVLALCSLLIVTGYYATAQDINTIAGTGAAAYGGDGSLCTSADINNPYGVAVNQAGDLYIADYGNNRIRKVDHTTGIITTIAGTGSAGFGGDGSPATAALIQHPTSIAVDASGTVYFCDYGNNRIRKIDYATTNISTIAGNFDGLPAYYGDGGMADTSHLGFPWGLALDNGRNLIFADQSNNRIRKIDLLSGIISSIAGTGIPSYSGDGGPAISARVQAPKGVAIDRSGNIYIADDGNNRVRKITPSGTISTIAGSATYGFTGDGGPSTAAKLYLPRGIAVDGAGSVYICDFDNNRIRKINAAGIINTLTGNGTAGYSGDGGPAIAAEVNQPTGIAVDTAGNIFISDNDNNRIRVIRTLSHAPYFVKGHNANLIACVGESFIDSLLPVFDIDTSQTETWSVISGPATGTAFVSYVTTSTGGVLNTAIQKYAASAPGTDSFKVRVTDGLLSDTINIHVTVLAAPTAAPISGTDTMCIGAAYTASMTDPTPGGVWSMTNGNATISAGGVVTGATTGHDTVRYTVTNMCGSDVAMLPIYIQPSSLCFPTATPLFTGTGNDLNIFPNPTDGELVITLSSAATEDAQFVITNMTGRKVKEFSAKTNQQTTLDINEPAGIYFISVTTAHGKWLQKISITKQ